MDDVGFPLPLTETIDNYFQNDGYWYNNGNEKTEGNNPHYGPYDIGTKYLNQFKCFVPNFNDFITGLTTVTTIKNSFTDFDKGNFTVGTLPTYPNYGTLVSNATIIEAGLVTYGDVEGPNLPVSSDDNDSLKIKFKPGNGSENCNPCTYNLSYNENGFVYITETNKPLDDTRCCQHYVDPDGLCYWCPQTVTEVCTPQEYIDLFSESQIEAYAESLGWDLNSNKAAEDFVLEILTPFFTENGCLVVDTTNIENVITIRNNQCCQSKGGNLVEYEGSYYCVKSLEDPCNNYEEVSHVYTIDGQLMSETCCISLGFNWNGSLLEPSKINIYNESGQIVGSFTDNVAQQYVTSITNSKFYCSACPQNIKESADGLLAYNPETETTTALSQTCCIDFGFTYDSASGKCLKCPTPSLSQSGPVLEVVFPPNTNVEECCTSLGFYYYDAETTNNGNIPITDQTAETAPTSG
jgi:hypothetical protein